MHAPRSRREVLGSALRLSGGLVAASAVGATALAEVAEATVPAAPFPKTPQAALDRLLAGNRRFVAGEARSARRGSVRRLQLASSQMPFAVVLTCADSRVPPELIFDQGLGDLFVVRIAGNTAADPLVVGSIEYSIAVLGSIVVFVLGHSDCGAVKGAIDTVTKGTTFPGDIGDVVAPIIPAVEQVKEVPKDELLDAAIDKNIELAVAQLSEVAILRDLVDSGKLMIAGGEYELESGQVDLIE
jgi:carbonic anhydrase